MKHKFIKLSKAERQSNMNRQKHAELLILQLPENHDGRNTWLLNYGTGKEAKARRLNRGLRWISKTQCCKTFYER